MNESPWAASRCAALVLSAFVGACACPKYACSPQEFTLDIPAHLLNSYGPEFRLLLVFDDQAFQVSCTERAEGYWRCSEPMSEGTAGDFVIGHWDTRPGEKGSLRLYGAISSMSDEGTILPSRVVAQLRAGEEGVSTPQFKTGATRVDEGSGCDFCDMSEGSLRMAFDVHDERMSVE